MWMGPTAPVGYVRLDLVLQACEDHRSAVSANAKQAVSGSRTDLSGHLPSRCCLYLIHMVWRTPLALRMVSVYVLPGIVGGYVLPVAPAYWMSAECRLLWRNGGLRAACCLASWASTWDLWLWGSGSV